MGSIAGMGHPGDHAVYAASKSFSIALAENLRSVLREYGVRVMAVNPGVVRGTKIFETGFTDKNSKNRV